jgi:hypothetical protein
MMTKKNQYKTSIYLILLLFITIVSFAQQKSIILGRPTDTSITASILFDQNVTYYIEYGTQSGIYSNTTSTYNWLVLARFL